MVLFIDITWNQVWPEFINLLRRENIPYIHIDVTIRPFVRAFFKFTDFTNTHDVAMIFQNEKGEIGFRIFFLGFNILLSNL